MTRSHYDTLGVERAADPAVIKRAYRRKAMKAHSDKGGNDADMAQVNRAYDVLSDPERRLQYDQTGTDERARPIDAEARDVLLKVFQQLLQLETDVNFVHKARELVRIEIAKIEANATTLERKQAQLKRRRDKVKAKKGENVFQMLIDDQLKKHELAMAQIQRGQLIFARVIELLENYEGEEVASVLMFTDLKSTHAGWGKWE